MSDVEANRKLAAAKAEHLREKLDSMDDTGAEKLCETVEKAKGTNSLDVEFLESIARGDHLEDGFLADY